MSTNVKPTQVTENRSLLNSGWSLIRSQPNEYIKPADINLSSEKFIEAIVPGTVAMSVNGSAPECWKPEIDYDDYDWWYQCQFNIEDHAIKNIINLHFSGLATLCEVWLNDKPILNSNNMFRSYTIDISSALKKSNTLILVFRSITENLKNKRARPKWKTKLVENQQMRWIRSTVLGHVSVWTPPIKAVGPWKNIFLQSINIFDIHELKINSYVASNTPTLSISAQLECLNSEIKIDKIYIKINNVLYPIEFSKKSNSYSINTKLDFETLALWMPHTHGTPNLYQCEFIINSGNNVISIDKRRIGFKFVDFKFTENESALYINNKRIFCRGTCWTVSDYLSLTTDRNTLSTHLTLLRDSGLNMLRVGGTMVYESDEFYQLCDELGIMVWQDFMFASMDYPIDDEDFSNNIKTEVTQQLERLNKHVCISTYCGNTDVEAQAAMFGMPENTWSNDFFLEFIPESCNKLHPGIPYLPSSPTGGTLPFHLSSGVTHYWGVGAYMHPITDTNKFRVKFASEGMGLSHIPENETIQECTGKNTLFPYHNEWTSRIPRDLGAGWDFDAIRDNYLEQIFDVDAVTLRRQNVEKYIALSKVVTGEVISQVFQQWRNANSQCNGGLIWFNRDFWPCAGFGLIDSNNQPKAAYYQLKNSWASQLCIITNEGLDGATISIINENKEELRGSIELNLYKDNNILIAQASQEIKISSNKKEKLSADKIFGRFYDTGYAYKFGTPQFDIMICRLKDNSDTMIHEAVMFIGPQSLKTIDKAEMNLQAKRIDNKTISLTINSNNFLQYVNITAKNYRAEDNYFHLTPNTEKQIILKQIKVTDTKFRGQLEAINLNNPIKIKLND